MLKLVIHSLNLLLKTTEDKVLQRRWYNLV
jgi:hypothetical protein